MPLFKITLEKSLKKEADQYLIKISKHFATKYVSHTQVADGRSKYFGFGFDCDFPSWVLKIPDFNKKQPWPSFLAIRLKEDASFEKPCVETGQGNEGFVLVYGNMGC